MAKIYKGFSTKRYEAEGGGFDLYNVDLIEEDLLNELYTLRGDRLRMPQFGTRVPILVFEPGDDDAASVLEEDVKQVIENDPRVELLALSIVMPQAQNALVAIAKVNYKEFNVVRDLRIEVPSR